MGCCSNNDGKTQFPHWITFINRKDRELSKFKFNFESRTVYRFRLVGVDISETGFRA